MRLQFISFSNTCNFFAVLHVIIRNIAPAFNYVSAIIAKLFIRNTSKIITEGETKRQGKDDFLSTTPKIPTDDYTGIVGRVV